MDIRDLEIVDEFRAWHLPALLEVQQKLSVWLDEGLALGQEELPITSRPKSLEAILAKLERSPISLPRMQDIAAHESWFPASSRKRLSGSSSSIGSARRLSGRPTRQNPAISEDTGQPMWSFE